MPKSLMGFADSAKAREYRNRQRKRNYALCPGDDEVRHTRWQDWERLLQEIILHSSYEAVILDVGDGIEEVFQILDLCTRVYVPVRDDRISKCKMEQFEKLLRLRDYSQLLAGTEKVLLPILSQHADNEFRIEELVWSELGDFVRELLEKENL